MVIPTTSFTAHITEITRISRSQHRDAVEIEIMHRKLSMSLSFLSFSSTYVILLLGNIYSPLGSLSESPSGRQILWPVETSLPVILIGDRERNTHRRIGREKKSFHLDDAQPYETSPSNRMFRRLGTNRRPMRYACKVSDANPRPISDVKNFIPRILSRTNGVNKSDTSVNDRK